MSRKLDSLPSELRAAADELLDAKFPKPKRTTTRIQTRRPVEFTYSNDAFATTTSMKATLVDMTFDTTTYRSRTPVVSGDAPTIEQWNILRTNEDTHF